MPTPLELAQSIAAYVPANVASRALRAAHDSPRPGEFIPVEAAVLFADVAGFTPMSERLALLGPLGTEELARILNETFTALITQISAHGGVVARFIGDALTVFFLHSPDVPSGETATRALTCARAMQRAITGQVSYSLAGGQPFNLSIKIGAGYGPAALLTVGDSIHGMEHVLAGAALDWAVGGERCARAGQVVAQASMLVLTDRVMGETRDEYVVLLPSDFIPDSMAPPADWAMTGSLPIPLAAAHDAELDAFIETCAPFLPRSVYARLLAGEGDFAGEHRRVTSMFVNFTGLHYDHPVAGEQLQAYVRAMQDVTTRFDGQLNRVLTGDKGSALHILFGAPDTHEDDLFRALRCALALQAEAAQMPFITDQRIGIASGVVFAGPVGSAARREYTVIGDTVNLSSRLTSTCDPGCILVDAYTRDRTAQRFTYEARPPAQLKGKAEPVRAFRLLSERASKAGLAARYLASRWPLVGRESERADLLRAADRALAGHGGAVAVSGRPGVGKTRLVEEVVRHWVAGGGNGSSGECLSHGLNVPYLPWISFLSAFFDFRESDSPEDHWRKVEKAVADEAPEMSPWAGVLASLLGLPAPASPVTLLDAAERRLKLFEVVTALLRARASRVPLLVLFEDIHWADQSSLDLLDHAATRIHDVPLLICLSFRTPMDFKPDVLASQDCTLKELDELGEKSAEELVRAILGEAGLSPQVAHLAGDIHGKTLGNPLFIEEILNSLIENGVLVREGGQYRLVRDASQVQIPDTLQSLLMARLDRLEPPTRDLAQVASVIGQHFAYAVLRGVYPYPMADTAMRERLEDLVQVDLTRLEHADPELSYLFKHALTYEVVYNCLPFARRRELHARVGGFLEWLYHDHLEEVCGVLARHWEQGLKWDKALVTALMAGTQAQELYANQDALAFYRLAERCLENLPAASSWINALRLYLNRGRLHRVLGQYAAAEADLYRALDLAREYDDTRARAEGYNLLAELRYWQERNEETLQSARLAYDLASQSGHNAEGLTALRLLGTAHYAMRQFDQAMAYFLQAHDLARQQGDLVMLGMILNAIGTTHYSVGRFDSSLEAFHRALDLLEAANLKHRVAGCLTNIGNAQFRRGQPEAALKAHRQAVTVALTSGFQAGLAYMYLNEAEVSCYLGEYAQALALCEQARVAFQQTGDAVGEAYQRVQAGEVYLALGLAALAHPALESAARVMRECGNVEESMRALLGLVECRLRENDLEAADAHLRQVTTLGQSLLPLWRQVWVFCLEGRLALARRDLARARALAQEAEQSVNAGSDPGALGPMWMLRAQIALAHGSPDEARACFECAGRAALAQSSFAAKLLVLQEAGTFLAADPDAGWAGHGRQWLEEAAAAQRHLEAEREHLG